MADFLNSCKFQVLSRRLSPFAVLTACKLQQDQSVFTLLANPVAFLVDGKFPINTSVTTHSLKLLGSMNKTL